MALTTRHLAEFLSSAITPVTAAGTATIVITTSGTTAIGYIFSGTATIVMTTNGIESQTGTQAIVITASGVAVSAIAQSQTITITTTGVENLGYFDSGTMTIVMFTEGRAKVHAFNVYKDNLQNLTIT